MTNKVNVLIVEDDESLRASLADQLALYEDYGSLAVGTAGEALEMIDKQRFDIVLLDIGLPDMDGRETCRLMRRHGLHAPVIMLTGMDSDADVILGLDSGANDYIVKPFRISVLLARIRAQLRQHEMSEDAAFSLGPYIFKPSVRRLINKNTEQEIKLSDKECAILKHLYRAGDAVVACDTLYSEIWGHSAPLTTHTLQTHIYRLRQKIEQDASKPQILKSEAGGYRVLR
jgi:DNA-binding response OmpR family regulator